MIDRETVHGAAAAASSHPQHLGQLRVGQPHNLLGALVLVAELAHEVADNHADRHFGAGAEARRAAQVAVLDGHVGGQAEGGAQRHGALHERLDVAFAQHAQLFGAELVVGLDAAEVGDFSF